MQKGYNVTLFIIVFMRTVIVSMFVASVNDKSKTPVHLLNSVPTAQYNTEVEEIIIINSLTPVFLFMFRLLAT